MLSVRERVLAIRLMEKLEKHSAYGKRLGVEVVVSNTEEKETCL